MNDIEKLAEEIKLYLYRTYAHVFDHHALGGFDNEEESVKALWEKEAASIMGYVARSGYHLSEAPTPEDIENFYHEAVGRTYGNSDSEAPQIPELREKIFDMITDPPCCGTECEFWDVEGYYCFLKDMHPNSSKCQLTDKFLALIQPLIDQAIQEQRELYQVRDDERVGNTWYWQGDGKDKIDSLTCPIIITPYAFKKELDQAVQAERAKYVDEIQTLKAEKVQKQMCVDDLIRQLKEIESSYVPVKLEALGEERKSICEMLINNSYEDSHNVGFYSYPHYDRGIRWNIWDIIIDALSKGEIPNLE